MNSIELKKDKYFENRKGYSQIYSIHCAKCDELLTYYQKDGGGHIKRLYLDRINNPIYKQDFSIDKKISCHKCGSLIGLGYLYNKEQRPAYKLFEQSIKVRSTDFIQNIKFLLAELFIR